MKITILNSANADYLLGLVSGLAKVTEDKIDVLYIKEYADMLSPFKNVTFLPVYSMRDNRTSIVLKLWNIIRFYHLQISYLLKKKSRIIHFQWLDRYKFIDRIVLPLASGVRGHKVVMTVHNVNTGKRDNHDTWFNRFSLKLLYNKCNHLIVHTEYSKHEMENDFQIPSSKISVIKHGMNTRVFKEGLTQAEARNRLQIGEKEKVVLFFGNIDYYKGLDILLESLAFMPAEFVENFRLVIAGKIKSDEHIKLINGLLEKSPLKDKIIAHVKFINNKDVESYFMAADCVALPYRKIYQSGIIFMAYSFGLPVLASDVGNFKQDVPEGKSGFLVSDNSPIAWSRMIQRYFASELYHNLEASRQDIKTWADLNYSWDDIGAETRKVYESLLQAK
jgi:glycosyltransferase involved in cell wall biosynthesis